VPLPDGAPPVPPAPLVVAPAVAPLVVAAVVPLVGVGVPPDGGIVAPLAAGPDDPLAFMFAPLAVPPEPFLLPATAPVVELPLVAVTIGPVPGPPAEHPYRARSPAATLPSTRKLPIAIPRRGMSIRYDKIPLRSHSGLIVANVSTVGA
jgi:hypothetical protein